jgi:hypothetical protein
MASQDQILGELVESLKEQWDKACESEDASSWKDKACIASALTSALRQLHRPADVKAFLKSSEWIDMRTKILSALAPYPDALCAVVEALGGS